MRFLGRGRPEQRRPRFTGPVTLQPIGWVENSRSRPQPHGWDRLESAIILAPEHEGRAAGLASYSHVVVLFYMDMAADAPEKPESLVLASGNRYGILATRSQLRPNHIGMTVVQLLGVEGAVLRVRGLDAIDGSAVLDIKPYLPEYDSVAGAQIPGGAM